MATNLGTRSKKLYFDVILPATRHSQSFLCTQYTAGTPGDRYGCLLQALQSCTGSTPPTIKRARAVSAWFQPSGISLQNVTTPANEMFAVAFVAPTLNSNYTTVLAGLPYRTVGGAAVVNKGGHAAIYGTAGTLRHFSVQVYKTRATSGIGYGGTITSNGVLYVQRQHSIEV